MARYDFVVLGSGPAGRRAAVQAAKLGKSVLVIDNRARVGGVSVHTGTIPSKTLRETVLNLSGWRERGFYGQSYRVKKEVGGADLAARVGKTLEHEIAVLEHQFGRNGVQTVVGHARFLDANRIAIVDRGGSREIREVVEADKVLIAVGTMPFVRGQVSPDRGRRGSRAAGRGKPAGSAEPADIDPADAVRLIHGGGNKALRY